MKGHINIQYLTDQEGNKTAVLIPIADWLEISTAMEDFFGAYQTMNDNLATAFSEVEAMKKGEKDKVHLSDFLDELD